MLFLEPPSSFVLLKKRREKKQNKSSQGSLRSAGEGGLSLIWNQDLKKEKEEDEEGGEESRGGVRGTQRQAGRRGARSLHARQKQLCLREDTQTDGRQTLGSSTVPLFFREGRETQECQRFWAEEGMRLGQDCQVFPG